MRVTKLGSSPLTPNPLPASGEGIFGSVFDGSSLNVNDHDALGFEIIIKGFGAVLAADAAGLHAAEGQLIVAIVK